VSQGLAQGSTPVLYPYEQTSPSLTVANYFATKQFLGQKKGVAQRFKRAMDQSLVYSQSHPEAVRKAVLTTPRSRRWRPRT